ncbi:MAG: OmpA family protein [Bacteroidota bacterium]
MYKKSKVSLPQKVISLFLILVVSQAAGQNLIANFSFEDHKLCPEDRYFGKTAWPVVGWYNVNDGTPDYYHRCSNGKVKVPDNWAGQAQPVHGNAYMGLYLWGKSDYREYIGIELTDSLEAGARYFFDGYYQIAHHSHYVTGSIGIAITDEPRYGFLAQPMNNDPQIFVRKADALEGDVFQWEKISGSFIAKGGEKYLSVGNFDRSENVSKAEIFVNAQKEFELIDRSYAFIDHFRLWKEGTEVPPDSSFHEPEPEKFILSDINFEFDQYQLKDTAQIVLEPLINYLNKRAENSYVLMITGFTDDVGTPEYNLKLSTNRARAVAYYLYQQGIPRNLLKVFGKGEILPLAPNDSEENRQKNRRVEIEIREVW